MRAMTAPAPAGVRVGAPCWWLLPSSQLKALSTLTAATAATPGDLARGPSPTGTSGTATAARGARVVTTAAREAWATMLAPPGAGPARPRAARMTEACLPALGARAMRSPATMASRSTRKTSRRAAPPTEMRSSRRASSAAAARAAGATTTTTRRVLAAAEAEARSTSSPRRSRSRARCLRSAAWAVGTTTTTVAETAFAVTMAVLVPLAGSVWITRAWRARQRRSRASLGAHQCARVRFEWLCLGSKPWACRLCQEVGRDAGSL
mmetsp:Transcript_120257/g.312141  ORF Transcript_120257/g.312141 Transcript_120257/m.312141 type:complete len:265 (+) Transcript_120257:1715-2509(+)